MTRTERGHQADGQNGSAFGQRGHDRIGATGTFETLQGESNICSGDSGGPILAKIDGVEKIVAINSYGRHACIGESQGSRLDLYFAFIRRHVAF